MVKLKRMSFKLILTIILLAAFLLAPASAGAALVDPFGGKIVDTYDIAPFGEFGPRFGILKIKGPPDALVLVAGTMLGFGCKKGSFILGWGTGRRFGAIVNFFSFCGPAQ